MVASNYGQVSVFLLLFSFFAIAEDEVAENDQLPLITEEARTNATAPASVQNLTYIYDNFGRLSQVKAGNNLLIEYQYDAAGNRSQVVHVH